MKGKRRRKKRGSKRNRLHRSAEDKRAWGRGPRSIRKNFQRLMRLAEALKVRV